MRFLIDEMFSVDVDVRLREAGHDAVHVTEVELAGADDTEVLRFAAAEDRVTVTENAVDYVALIDVLMGEGVPVAAVVVALKRHLPRTAGALSHRLAAKLVAWAEANPTPHRHAHWLG